MAKLKIVDESFNCHNKISYIKNLMHVEIYFTENTLPKFVSLTWNFQGSFDKLCPNLPDSFSLSLCVYAFMNFI